MLESTTLSAEQSTEKVRHALHGRPMLLLAGEQAAPNLLPVRHFAPSSVIILHTDFASSKRSADNLSICLQYHHPEKYTVEAYNPHKVFTSVMDVLNKHPDATINVTGGTKPMSEGALAAARVGGRVAFYVRSQAAKTEVDLYRFDAQGVVEIDATYTIPESITIDEYLTVYSGNQYHYTGFGSGPGEPFERAVHDVLEPEVDECKIGWKDNSGAVDVDLIVRCANQLAVIEAKTGGAARRTDGIKQLAVAGEQRFLGTYVRRILVVDQSWDIPSLKNNRELAKALNITLIELPGFAAEQSLSADEKGRLVKAVHGALGRTARAA